MKLHIVPIQRLSFALAMLALGSMVSAQTTITLDFESETAGSTTLPSGWSYTSIAAGRTYTTSAASGGSNGAGGSSGLGGVLVSDNATFGTIIPNGFLLNSGTAAGFDLSKSMTGTYDFRQNNSAAYDSSAFLFGDIKSGSLPKTDAGQFLLAYHSQGGYGNAPNRLVNGTETDVGAVTGSVGGHNDNTWYRATFSWTPTAGNKGNFTLTTKQLSNNGVIATWTANGMTLTPAGAYLGFADLWAAGTTFDNISVTGTDFAGAYWDINGTTAGSGGTTPTGTWDGSSNWNPSSDGTGTTAAWTPGSVAIFSAGNDSTSPYTVTVSGTQDIGGLSFENGTPTLTGGTLRLVSNAYAFVKPGSTATIDSAISDDAGSRVFSKTGTGTLILSGDNSGASGSMFLADGITEVGALNSILGTGKNLTVDTTATLRIGTGIGAGNIQTALNRIVASSAGTIAADNYDSTNIDFNTPGLTAARLGAIGSVNYTGTLTPQGTVYRLGGGGGTLTMANTNALTGVGRSLIVQGNVVLAGANDYDSGTTLSSGTLTLGNAGSLGSGGLTITGGTLAATGTVATTNTIAANGDFTIGGTGTLTMGGNMTLNANRIITNNNTTNTTTFGAISGGTRTLTINGSGNTTISGNITTTSGTLTKNGTGKLILSGSNNYTGATTISAGVLQLSGNGTLGTTAGNATIASGSALELNNLSASMGEPLTNVAGTGVSSGGAIRNIAGSNTIAALVTITAATRINSDAGTLTFDVTSGNAITAAAAQNLTFGGAGNITIADPVATLAGTLTKDGAGTLALAGANTYTGLTTVNAGRLQFGLNNAIASGNAVTVSSTVAGATATLDLNGYASTIGGAGLTLGGSTATSTSQVIGTGAGSVLTLTGAATALTYSATNNPLGASISTTTLDLNGAAQTLTVGDSTSAGIDLGISSLIQNGSLVKAGAGTLVVTNASNSYSGGTTASAGILGFANGSLGSSGTINASGGTLLWLSGNTQDISSRLAMTAATTTTINTNGNDVTFASAIGSSASGILAKGGLGNLTLSGTNTYTGATALNNGGGLILDYTTNDTTKLSDTGALTLNSGTLTLQGGTHTEVVSATSLNFGAIIARNGGTAKLTLNAITRAANSSVSFADASIATTDTNNVNSILGGWATIGNDWAVSVDSGATDTAITALASYTPWVNTTGSATTNYLLNGAGSIVTTGVAANSVKITNSANNQTLALNNLNLTITSTSATNLGGIMYAGGSDNLYSITGGTGRIVTSGANQELIFAVQTGTLSVGAFIGASASTGSVTKTGAGTLDVSSANNYTGVTRINEGVLRLSNATAAGTTAGNIVVQNGAALELNGVSIGAETLNILGYGISNGGALRSLSTSSYAGAITSSVAGGSRINSDSGTLTLTGGIVTSVFQDITIGGAGNTTVSTTGISGTGGLIKDGAGTTSLSATNTYTGATTVSAGTLNVSGAGTINTSSAITVASGGTLRYNSSTALTVAPTLNGSGASNRAVLGGTGTINASLTLNDLGDVLSPGNSPGIQAFTPAQTWASMTYDWELNDWVDSVAGTNLDKINIAGGLNLSATTVNSYELNILSLMAGDAPGAIANFVESPKSWTILTASGGITGFDATEWFLDADGFTGDTGTWSINSTGTDLVLSYAPIPEPGAAFLGGLGLMLILRRRRN